MRRRGHVNTLPALIGWREYLLFLQLRRAAICADLHVVNASAGMHGSGVTTERRGSGCEVFIIKAIMSKGNSWQVSPCLCTIIFHINFWGIQTVCYARTEGWLHCPNSFFVYEEYQTAARIKSRSAILSLPLTVFLYTLATLPPPTPHVTFD